MSQAGIIDFIGTNPQIPTVFVANVGAAVPIANTLEILGDVVAAHGVPLQTTASGNTVNINVQYASAAGTSIPGNAGVASFDSASFVVDANGFVSLTAIAGATQMGVDASTPPGTNPVMPNGSGVINVTGGQVAAGTTTNVIQTNSLSANTYTIQIQRSSAQASSTIGANGVSHFNSAFFSVDANGFVSIVGTALGQTITGNTGGALSPTAGNWNIFGAAVAAGTTPVATAGAGSTLTVNVQRSQAIASTNASNVGLAAFDSAAFDVDANGFVSIAVQFTGNTGTAVFSAGNLNILGANGVTTAASGSTVTINGTTNVQTFVATSNNYTFTWTAPAERTLYDVQFAVASSGVAGGSTYAEFGLFTKVMTLYMFPATVSVTPITIVAQQADSNGYSCPITAVGALNSGITVNVQNANTFTVVVTAVKIGSY
jgi:hypothetical protein